MGIKMLRAFNKSVGSLVNANQLDGLIRSQFLCATEYCRIPVSHVEGHNKQVHESTIYVPPYFRLMPGKSHTENCSFNTKGRVAVIARDSESEVFESLDAGKYEFRLHIICKSLKQLSTERYESDPTTTNHPRPQRHYINKGKLSSYLKTMRQIMELRSQIENDDELRETVRLDFNGSSIRWKNFYFEPEDFASGFRYFQKQGDHPHPVCLQGYIKTIINPTEKYPFHSIKLHIPYVKPDANGIRQLPSVQFTVYESKLLDELAENARIVVYSLCKVNSNALGTVTFLNIYGHIYNRNQIHIISW